MKRMAFLVGLVVLVFAVAIQAQTGAKPKAQTAEQELLKLEQEWTNADVKDDLALLDRVLADDWVITETDGSVWTKAQILAAKKTGEDKISTEVTDDIKVRVYGNAAVVTGRNTLKGIFKGRDLSGQERWTDTWIMKAGRWQCVATHISKIAGK